MDDANRGPEDRWAKKDAWVGLLLASTGLLLVLFVVLTFANRSFVASPVIYILGGALGLALVLIGVNAIVRALRSS